MTDFAEQRSCIKLCYELGKSATETLVVLRSIYGSSALCRSKTFHWYSRFRDGHIPSSGKPSGNSPLGLPQTSTSSSAGKRATKRRKTNHQNNNSSTMNLDVSVIETQLNYVKTLMKLGKTPSETYTYLQSLFGPNALSRVELLSLYYKLEADQNSSSSPPPVVVKPPKKHRNSFPQSKHHPPATVSPESVKRQTQNLLTGGSFWHVPYNEKENTSLTENQVCFMDHFMLSGDSSKSYKITIPPTTEYGYSSFNDHATAVPDRTLPLPVENLNRMHVMDGDCTKSDIVAAKAPELQLQLPPPAAANGHEGVGGDDVTIDAADDVTSRLKAAATAAVATSIKQMKTAAEVGGEDGDADVLVKMKDGVEEKGGEDVEGVEKEEKKSEEETVEKINGDVSPCVEEDKEKEETVTKEVIVNGGGDTDVSDKCKVEEDKAGDSSSSESSVKLVNGDCKREEESMLVDEVEEEEEEEEAAVEKCASPPAQDGSVLQDEAVNNSNEEGAEKKDGEEVEDEEEEEEEEERTRGKEGTSGGVAVCSEDDERASVSSSQNRKRRLADTNGEAENCDNEVEGEGEVEGDAEGEDGEGSSSDSEAGTKRQRVEVEGEDERERLVREYVERCTQSVEEMSRSADRLQREIGALGELARAKELEWNSILRLRKLKEEMLERLLRRRRQTMMLADNGLGPPANEWPNANANANEYNKSKSNKQTCNNNNQQLMMVPIVSSSPTPSLHSAVNRQGGLSSGHGADTTRLARLQRPILPKPQQGHALIDQQNTVIGEGRQGPILDVKSIIADYRSKNPDNVPRRGRRMKGVNVGSAVGGLGVGVASSMTVSSTRISGSPALMSMANMALCSGAHIRNNSQDCNPGQENSRPSSTDSSRSTSALQSDAAPALPAPGLNFKDVLVQFAKMSQPPAAVTSLVPSKPNHPQHHPPPPYPEVTLHPVPAPTSHSPPSTTSSHSSSLLHGILTKSAAAGGVGTANSHSLTTTHRPTTFSPTLARLLTAPERERTSSSVASAASVASSASSHFRPPISRVSISDLLTTSKKTRNEITITPVSSHASHPKSKDGVVLLEDDPEETDSTDRLVIDEGASDKDRDGGGAGCGEDVPECQGCNQRAAQFVCAGCGNQWYCSRECQVTAWEEHSEMCSG